MKENMCLSLIENFSIKWFSNSLCCKSMPATLEMIGINHYLRNVFYIITFSILIFSNFLKFNKDKCNNIRNIPVIILLVNICC